MSRPGATEEDGLPLTGGRFAAPTRRGAVVERRAGPGSENIQALLAHLRARDIAVVPEPLGRSADGSREYLSNIEGKSGFPPMDEDMRSDEALVQAVRVVRAIHDATQDFVPPSPTWHYQEIARPVDADCFGHLDLAPWNFIFLGADVVGLIDWDTAAPTTRLWDLSYLAYQFVPMGPDHDLSTYGWDPIPDRLRRLRLLADTYGGITPAEILDVVPVRLAAVAAMIERRTRLQDPDYAVHARDRHAVGWRNAAAHVIRSRSSFLGRE